MRELASYVEHARVREEVVLSLRLHAHAPTVAAAAQRLGELASRSPETFELAESNPSRFVVLAASADVKEVTTLGVGGLEDAPLVITRFNPFSKSFLSCTCASRGLCVHLAHLAFVIAKTARIGTTTADNWSRICRPANVGEAVAAPIGILYEFVTTTRPDSSVLQAAVVRPRLSNAAHLWADYLPDVIPLLRHGRVPVDCLREEDRALFERILLQPDADLASGASGKVLAGIHDADWLWRVALAGALWSSTGTRIHAAAAAAAADADADADAALTWEWHHSAEFPCQSLTLSVGRGCEAVDAGLAYVLDVRGNTLSRTQASAALVRRLLSEAPINDRDVSDVRAQWTGDLLPTPIPPPNPSPLLVTSQTPPQGVARLMRLSPQQAGVLSSEAIFGIRLSFVYQGGEVLAGNDSLYVNIDQDGVGVRVARHRSSEAAIVKKVVEAGFVPSRHDRSCFVPRVIGVNDHRSSRRDVLLARVPALRDAGLALRQDESLRAAVHFVDDIVAEVEQGKKAGIVDVSLFLIEGTKRYDLLSALSVVLASAGSQSGFYEHLDALGTVPFIVRQDQRYFVIPSERLRQILRPIRESTETLAKASPMRLPVSTSIRFEPSVTHDQTGRLVALRGLLAPGNAHERIQPPSTFIGTLRPYQQEGLSWLDLLAQAQLGGVLADEMGLGKTVQIIAQLTSEHAAGHLNCPALIVMPTSLIANWKREMIRFAPSLRLAIWHGNDRHQRRGALKDCDVILTTYGLLGNDSEVLSEVTFSTIFYDEAQRLKSAATKRAIAARRLRARRHVMVSGTPLENHLHELWNLIDMAVPGLLGSAEQFRIAYREPIERGDANARRRLIASIAPFVLRRTKDQVAKDLPPKTEVTVSLDLHGAQRDFYNGLAASVSTEVRGLLATEGSSANVKILQALTRLQQAAAYPPLVKLPGATEVGEGVKMANLVPMLLELKEDGRKVLLYSRWRSMLDIFETRLKDTHRIVRIDGQTRDRAKPVQQFQSGEADIFLLTLGAGGVGLNLTAADVVVIHDPWWNPAVEDQAGDRAHRIGQTKPVFVYRLIVKGTIEEKVLEIRQSKSVLAEAILGDESVANTRIDAAQLDYLMEPIALEEDGWNSSLLAFDGSPAGVVQRDQQTFAVPQR